MGECEKGTVLMPGTLLRPSAVLSCVGQARPSARTVYTFVQSTSTTSAPPRTRGLIPMEANSDPHGSEFINLCDRL